MKALQLLIAVCASLLLTPLANAQKYHAFIWNSTSGMQDIGTLGGNTSYALGINDSGEVVGYAYLADNVTTHAFTWTASGGMIDLGALPGGSWTQGSAINSAGDIAGQGLDANGKQVPFYWSPSGGFVSLGENVGDSRNYGFGINDASDMTGQEYEAEVVRAYSWAPGDPVIHDIGTLPWGIHSVGNAINNLRHITGTASTSVVGRFVAFLWCKTGGMRQIAAIPGGELHSRSSD
jgi:probable HAF family extracellular repeat protein